jgi:hypothetical protein
MSDASFLDEVKQDAKGMAESIPRDEQLGNLAKKVEEQASLEDQVTELETQLAEKKKDLQKVSMLEIPEIMQELGISRLTMKSGSAVEVKPFYSGKITEEKSDQAFNWLEDHGHEGIIKGELIIMYKRPDKQRLGQFLELAKELGFLVKDKLTVHPMTLKAFIKEQITEGSDLPRDLFNVYVGWVTKITRNKI